MAIEHCTYRVKDILVDGVSWHKYIPIGFMYHEGIVGILDCEISFLNKPVKLMDSIQANWAGGPSQTTIVVELIQKDGEIRRPSFSGMYFERMKFCTGPVPHSYTMIFKGNH